MVDEIAETRRNSYKHRKNLYPGLQIPDDMIIDRLIRCEIDGDFDKASSLLSSFYSIPVPTVGLTEGFTTGDLFALYLHEGAHIWLSLEKLPLNSLQFTAFLQCFFLHLAHTKKWSYDLDVDQSIEYEHKEADSFAKKISERMSKISHDYRSN